MTRQQGGSWRGGLQEEDKGKLTGRTEVGKIAFYTVLCLSLAYMSAVLTGTHICAVLIVTHIRAVLIGTHVYCAY